VAKREKVTKIKNCVHKEILECCCRKEAEHTTAQSCSRKSAAVIWSNICLYGLTYGPNTYQWYSESIQHCPHHGSGAVE
jgi:hypothetical protein